jgi:hypothetical protein
MAVLLQPDNEEIARAVVASRDPEHLFVRPFLIGKDQFHEQTVL